MSAAAQNAMHSDDAPRARTGVASKAAKKHTLYWNPICPFVQRALIAMEEKGCAHIPERIFISLEDDAPDFFRKVNPRETVPTLAIEGEPTVYESAFVAQYFDREFGTPNQLLPPIPQVRDDIREFEEIAQPMIESLYGVFFLDDRKEAIKHAKKSVEATEKFLERRVKAHGGPFFLGRKFSMADIFVVPFLQRFSATLPAYRDFDPLEKAPALRELLEAAQLRPSVYQTSMTPMEYVSAYKAYGGKDAPSQKPEVKLFPGSPFSLRIPVAAALAGIDIEVDLGSAKADKKDRLPVVTIPGLPPAYESMRGMMFLLEAHRKTREGEHIPLHPSDGALFARAQFLAQEGDNLGSKLIASLKPKASDEVTKELMEAIRFTESYVIGPFAVGSEPSFADAVIAPHIWRLRQLKGEAGLAGAPKLKRLLDELGARDNVAVALDYGNDQNAFNKFVEHA